MWVFTQGGFVSIVRHRTKPDMMLVRSRGRAHLENFTRGYSCVKVIHTPGADYEYRVLMGETAVKRMLANAVDDADYDNFKNCVDHVMIGFMPRFFTGSGRSCNRFWIPARSRPSCGTVATTKKRRVHY